MNTTHIIKTDFNTKIKINLCCGNCIYKLIYTYINKAYKQAPSQNFYEKINITCLINKAPYQINKNNQFEEKTTCDIHDLGSSFGGAVIKCPTNIEQFNLTSTLTVLFNLRPDIVTRFKNVNKIKAHELKEYNQWNKQNNS